MLLSLLSAAAAFAALATAQTPEGFTPAVTTKLDVTFGSKAVSPAGLLLTKAETAKIPTIGLSSGNLTGTYIFFVIDLDVPSGANKQTLLHAMIQDFKPSDGGKKLTSSATGPTTYMGPAPPDKNAHRYVELLYEQPADFAVPAAQRSAVQARMGFNMAAFATAAKLTTPIAGNYFKVTG